MYWKITSGFLRHPETSAMRVTWSLVKKSRDVQINQYSREFVYFALEQKNCSFEILDVGCYQHTIRVSFRFSILLFCLYNLLFVKQKLQRLNMKKKLLHIRSFK